MKALLATVLLVALAAVGYTQLGNDNETINVLFVGNSYTSSNNLPEHVAEVLDANGINLEYDMIAPGGQTLARHSMDLDVRTAINGGTYDIVILQDQSETPAINRLLINDSIPAAETLGQLAANAGSEVIMFQTWGHQNGSSNAGYSSYESMQSALNQGYSALATAANARIAPVGSIWKTSLASNSIRLHSADGSHPSEAGTYLASLVIARTILGEELTEFPTNGLPQEEVDLLAALLW